MAMNYIEQYETKKAVVEMYLDDGNYRLEYVVTGPIDGAPTEVNATIVRTEEDRNVRVGYGAFSNGSTSVRFNDSVTSVPNQASISTQFYNDLQTILE